MDQKLLDGFKPDKSNTWRTNAIKKVILILNPIHKYIYWLIPEFTSITKKARLTLERLAKMIIGDNMTFQEKNLLFKILFNQKTILI